MANTKILNFENIFLFLFFIIFPFGQILRIGILQPLDVIVALGALYAFFRKFKKPQLFKYFDGFLFTAAFSWIFGSLIFKQTEVFYGILYLFRLFAYFYFFLYVWNFTSKNLNNKKLVADSLLAVSVASAVFGWIQFIKFPDIKPFFEWGWDMHLFRLVGTFLDPSFLGLIFVFGILVSMYRYIDTRKKKYIYIIIFLLPSLAFTYSRASFLALAFGVFTIIYLNNKFKKFLFLVAALSLIVFMLPTAKNHSISLFRSFSAIAKVENYKVTLKIFSQSPVFGIGYNNMCLAYQKYIGFQPFSSHACSGSDSSLLFVLTTTGIAGLIILIYSLHGIAGSIKKDSGFQVLAAGFAALLVHSLFSNSMFYPWIITYMLILLSLCVRKKNLT